MKLTYQAILDNPDLLEQTLAQARRERAEAVQRLLVAPLRRLFSLKAPPALRTSACG